jgi:hypothetical protein
MAIISAQTAPNFAVGNYHRILRAEINCAPGDPNPRWVVLLGFYANEYARDQAGDAPLYTRTRTIDFAQLLELGLPDPRIGLYDYLLNHDPLFKDVDAASDETPEAAPAPSSA